MSNKTKFSNVLKNSQFFSITSEHEISNDNFNNLLTDDIKNSELILTSLKTTEDIDFSLLNKKAYLLNLWLKKNIKTNNKIFIFSNEDEICFTVQEIFSKILAQNKKNLLYKFKDNNISLNLAINEIINNDYDLSIFILNLYNNNYKIFIRKKEFNKLSSDDEEFLNKKILNLKTPNIDTNKNFSNIFVKENNNNLFFEKEKINLKNSYYFFTSHADEKNILNFVNNKDNIKINLNQNFNPKLNFNIFQKIKFILKNKYSKNKKDIFFYINHFERKKIIFAKNKNKYEKLDWNSINLLLFNYLNSINKLKDKKIYHLNHEQNFLNDILSQNFNLDFIKLNEHYPLEFIYKIKKSELKNENFYLINKNKVYFLSKDIKNNIFGLNDVNNTLLLIKMFEYYKKNKINIFDKLNEIKKELSIENIFENKLFFSNDAFFNLVKNIKFTKRFGDFEVKKYSFIKEEHFLLGKQLKFILDLNSKQKINLLFNTNNNTLTTSIISLQNKNDDYKKIIFNEEKIINYLSEYKISKNNFKNNKKKEILKISFSILIIILTILFLLFNVYKSNGENVLGIKIFENFYKTFMSSNKNKIQTLLIILGTIASIFIGNSLVIYKIAKFNNQKIKISEAFAASILGILVANLTPFAFGGEIISYWYLQKKGHKKSILATIFTITAMMHQILILIISLTFMPLGFVYYKNVFLENIDAAKIITFIFTILGFILNISLLLIIIFISMFKKIQKFIILIWIYIISFFVFDIDIERKRKLIEIKMDIFKNNYKKTLKNKKLFLEIIFYKIISYLIFPIFIVAYMIANDGDFTRFYINFLTGNSLINAANNLSPIPGGIGTGDLLTIQILSKNIFSDLDNVKFFAFSKNIFFWLIPNIISLLTIITVFFGEKRIAKYKIINKLILFNPKLKNRYKKTKSIYFKLIFAFWVIFIISLIFLFIFI
ncbi:lysylphosphatidylglycerol synthase transmembrane domain-containing protein [[Mycoplasma] collis]|uniref:lysylphosphatidylglycerol synthase transmembrane domain-containing protein n=1 Tax=[Mycoplasma] collis TaxID=2127 RepID=UPI00051B8583|nr:lysylphosphatidylglycerol synthase transmembrane domain-containing protein [[Mycoplasma] collis]